MEDKKEVAKEKKTKSKKNDNNIVFKFGLALITIILFFVGLFLGVVIRDNMVVYKIGSDDEEEEIVETDKDVFEDLLSVLGIHIAISQSDKNVNTYFRSYDFNRVFNDHYLNALADGETIDDKMFRIMKVYADEYDLFEKERYTKGDCSKPEMYCRLLSKSNFDMIKSKFNLNIYFDNLDKKDIVTVEDEEYYLVKEPVIRGGCFPYNDIYIESVKYLDNDKNKVEINITSKANDEVCSFEEKNVSVSYTLKKIDGRWDAVMINSSDGRGMVAGEE